MNSCNKLQHEVAACLSMLQLDMLQPVRACCSRCSRTCCHLFKHVAAGHVATCSSMLQPDMLPHIQACCSWTCCHVACCSLIRTCFSRDISSLFRTPQVQMQLRPMGGKKCINVRFFIKILSAVGDKVKVFKRCR
jgi:hypothetical protein